MHYVIIQFLIAEKWAKILISVEKSPKIELTTKIPVSHFQSLHGVLLYLKNLAFKLRKLIYIVFKSDFVTPFVIRIKSRRHTCQVIDKLLKPKNNKGIFFTLWGNHKRSFTWVVTCN